MNIKNTIFEQRLVIRLKREWCANRLESNKVKYSNMSAYEQVNYMNDLYDENMGFLIFISIIIVEIFRSCTL